jgi:hypothetical protein
MLNFSVPHCTSVKLLWGLLLPCQLLLQLFEPLYSHRLDFCHLLLVLLLQLLYLQLMLLLLLQQKMQHSWLQV